MTRRDELLALAERVEQLDGACWETEQAIFQTLYPKGCFDDLPAAFRHVPTQPQSVIPTFTASLDAAMSLVPPAIDHWPQVIMTGTNPNNPAKQRERVEIWVKGKRKPFRSNAATPALALCAAALRALAERVS